MGGNGARAYYYGGTLDAYIGVQFKQVGEIDGVKVIAASTQDNKAIPMESFTSSMYYITIPDSPEQITNIAFYDGNCDIKVALDLYYDSAGNLLPFKESVKKGKKDVKGSHMHRWKIDDKGGKGRKPHAEDNVWPINRYYMRFVNKALKYNASHGK